MPKIQGAAVSKPPSAIWRSPFLDAPPLGAALAASIGVPQFDPANLIAGFVFGSIGFVAFTYGKRMSLWKPMFCGIALMVYPYFIENMFLLFGIGGIGTLALFFLRD